MKTKNIYFSLLIFLLFVGLYCLFNLDASNGQKFLFPHSVISLASWIFSLLLLKDFVAYEEGSERNSFLRNIYEFIAGLISSATGAITFKFIWSILDWEYSLLFTNIVPLFISMFICTMTGVPEDPQEKKESKELQKHGSDHGINA
ncbi:MAG: hypothetical protein RL687_206 [Candidatus Parcubacteria bacterium]|jgi:ABC-type bacteriocin/lantibiotic exporter with double-glycine peptidase domain